MTISKLFFGLVLCVLTAGCAAQVDSDDAGAAGAAPDQRECSKRPWECPRADYEWVDCYSTPTDPLCQASANWAPTVEGWVMTELESLPGVNGQYHSQHCPNGVRVWIGVEGALATCI